MTRQGTEFRATALTAAEANRRALIAQIDPRLVPNRDGTFAAQVPDDWLRRDKCTGDDFRDCRVSSGMRGLQSDPRIWKIVSTFFSRLLGLRTQPVIYVF